MAGNVFIDRLVIVGVGLIGGSLARALREASAVGEIVGVGRTLANLDRALALGVIDRIAAFPEALVGADVVVLAAPVGAMDGLLARAAPALGEAAVITDVGSVKGAVIAAARRRLGAAFPRFVPGHPIAGTEHSGVEASFATLFHDHRIVVTPTAETDARALARVRRLWACTGGEVIEMAPEEHDGVLAATSHLPHVLAYALVDMIAALPEGRRCFELAAGGFYDFTRIASSDAVMWRDICVANAGPLGARLRQFADTLARLGEAVEAGDGEQLEAIFRRAKSARDRLLRERGDARAGGDGPRTEGRR